MRHGRPRPRPAPRRPAEDGENGRRARSTQTLSPAETIVVGLRAVLALIDKRPDDVRAIVIAREAAADVPRGILEGLQRRGVTVEERAPRELEDIAGTKQHEGIVARAKERRWLTPSELAQLLVDRRGACLALDRVRNSYNVGAILRSAAFFGVDAVLLGAPAPHPALDRNAVRVAEGGAEHVPLSRTTDLRDTLDRLRAKGVRVYGTDGHATQDATTCRFARPCVVVMGNEREGLGPRVREVLDATVAIRGSGTIESLNVGVAAGIVLARIAHAG